MNVKKIRYMLISLFILMYGFSGLGYGHGNDTDSQYSHASEDAFLAEQAVLSESITPSEYIDHWQQQFSEKLAALSTSILSELINPALAATNNPAIDGRWDAKVTLPFVFASASNLPDGRILVWGANEREDFTGANSTHSAIWNPVDNSIFENDHSAHSLFCGMPVMLEDGRILVSGGDTNSLTSVKMTSTFKPGTGTTGAWARVDDLKYGRWYNGTVALPDGKVFSAVGEPGSQYPEKWTEGKGWDEMLGASLKTAILDHPTLSEPKHWLPHLHLAPNGQVFHSGHTPKMHYIDMEGEGAVYPVAIENDWNTANTPSILYDEGKIIQAGGALYDTARTSTTKAALIDLNSTIPSRTLIPDMQYSRIFHNQVVLPNGEVMVIGGNTSGEKFSDKNTTTGVSTSILTPELWSPTTQFWRPAAPHTIPRNYHSVALLMTDGRVWSGGGGLGGGCAVAPTRCHSNHPDFEIYSPAYLFNADGSPVDPALRPKITNSPTKVAIGQKITVSATSGTTKFTMIRMSATTHATNTDMRFLNVPFTSPNDGQYVLTLHTNPNVLMPGYWMLFALNAQGVPSIARVIQISTSSSPDIANIDEQLTIVNTTVNLPVVASDPNSKPLTFSAAGLPTGLTINSTTGLISGIPRSLGNKVVIVSATNGTSTVSIKFVWRITDITEPLPSAVFGGIGGTIFKDTVLPSQNLTGINVRTGGRIDGIQAILNTGPLANHGGTGGTLRNVTWPADEYLVRIFGVHGAQVGKISFATNTGRILGPFGAATSTGSNGSTFDFTVPADTEIVGFTGRASIYLDSIGVMYRNRTDTNQPPVVTVIADQADNVGELINLEVLATDPEGDPITFSATGLPAGLTLSPTTGVISGTLTAAAVKNVVLNIEDNKGASAGLNFKWTVTLAQLLFDPVTTAPQAVATEVTFTASLKNGINPRYKWNFGDNTAETAYSANATVKHTFNTAQLFSVKVTATDDTGATNSQTFKQAIYLPHTTNKPTASTNIMVDKSNRLWVVNQDNDTVSVFNATSHAKLGEVTVGKSPRAIALAPDGKIWVTNKLGASISVINAATAIPLAAQQNFNLPYASQPFGLAFASDNSVAYVVLEATGKLVKLNPTTGIQIGAALDIGTNPRHLSVTADSSKVLVSRFITPPMPGEATNTIDTSTKGGEVVIVNTAGMTINKTLILQHSNQPDGIAHGSGIPNYLAMPVISPDGGSAWVPSKQDNIKRGEYRNGNPITFESTVRSIASKINLNTLAEVYSERIDFDNSGIGSAAIFDQSGNYLFVALESTQEIAMVDAYAGTQVGRIKVGMAPDGLTLSADGKKVFVNNFMNRSVSVIDIAGVLSWGDPQPPVIAQFTASTQEKLSATVLKGKQLFYDAKDMRLARDGYLSCAVCHNDGGHDGRVWDLTNFGEGLRNTIDLRGRAGITHGILHWSGNFDEIQDFEGQIRHLAEGTGLMAMAQTEFDATQSPLGVPKAGQSTDLDALAAYVTSLTTFSDSPLRNADSSLTTDALAGKALFISAGCTQCHGGTPFTDSPAGVPHNVGTFGAGTGKRLNGTLNGLDSPTLRDAWNTAPYLHDGSAQTLEASIRRHNNVTLTDAEIALVASYVKQIGGKEPGLVINDSPVVTITAPTSGATVSGTTVAVSANATDSNGIATVQFKLDGVNLNAVENTAPYTITWNTTTTTNGSHTLTAVATDSTGMTSLSDPLTVTVNNGTSLPDVVVTALSYANGAFTSTIKNQGTKATPTGITIGVSYSVDGVYRTWGARTTPIAAGATVTIGTGGAKYFIPNGVHTIMAKGDDTNRFAEADETNNTLSQTINVGGSDTVSPTVSLTAPLANATVGGSSVNVTANAADNVAVAGVQFKLDGTNIGTEDTTAPYGITWSTVGVSNGSHTLTAVAKDTAGLTTTSNPITVTINNSDVTLPTVSITAPAANSTLSGTAENIAANAADNVAVAGVQFKLDGVNLGAEDTTAPYTFTWNTTGVTNGAHTLTAVARDSSGNLGNSAAIAVTVSNTATPSLPDVVVVSVTYDKATGVFTSQVKNQGLAATPAGVTVGVGYSVDGVFRTWGARTTPIAAGATVTIGTGGTKYFIATGTHNISANVDDSKRFTESDETNNILTRSIAVP